MTTNIDRTAIDTEVPPPDRAATVKAPAAATRLMVWRSPDDQPRWTRPVLLLVAALAGVAYGWHLSSFGLEPYYAASVRTMAGSWHHFLYGAFDPAGRISLDKVPGAFWPQALSVRVFGMHVWAIALPQVIEGVLAVLVLYRAVRRLAGPVPGMLAATVLAASPATVLLHRGNVADPLFVLLLVLAADATSAAVRGRRMGPLLLAGVWVGLAFQAKMAEAWLILPALATMYLVAAPVSVRQRLIRLGAAGALTAVVSLSWMLLVTATPAEHRPYVDGSSHNSVFEQVFAYNGTQRFDDDNPLARMAATQEASLPAEARDDAAEIRPAPSWDRLFSGGYGRDIGWLLPVAVVTVVGVLIARRRADRQDPVRAAVLLWGVWLVTFLAVFSVAELVQPYYLGVLAPAVAALAGIGGWAVWQAGRMVRAAASTVVGATVLYQLWLLPASGTGRQGWLAPVLIAAAVLAFGTALVLAVSPRAVSPRAVSPRAVSPRAVSLAGLVGLIALIGPAATAGAVVNARLGAFDTPYQPDYYTGYTRRLATAPEETRALLPTLERVRSGGKYLLATSSGLLAASVIYVSGADVLPIGGFTGTFPPPTVDELKAMVAAGDVRLVVAVAADKDPRISWVAGHCARLPLRTSGPTALQAFACAPASAAKP